MSASSTLSLKLPKSLSGLRIDDECDALLFLLIVMPMSSLEFL